MNAAKAILMGARPNTLLLGLGPVVLGSIYGGKLSESGVSPWLFAASVFLVMSMQAAANLVNDVKDALSGVDNQKTRLGPKRVVASGFASADLIRNAYRILFVLALLVGSALVIYVGWSALAVACLCCLFAYMYTGGPFPLSHLGLGELVAWLFFGPVAVAGSSFLQQAQWTKEALLLGFGHGFIAAAVMAINNFRDRPEDVKQGKKTLATRLPEVYARWLPELFIIASLLCFAFYCWNAQGNLLVQAAILILLTLPMFLKMPGLLEAGGIKLNSALKMTTIWSAAYTSGLLVCIW